MGRRRKKGNYKNGSRSSLSSSSSTDIMERDGCCPRRAQGVPSNFGLLCGQQPIKRLVPIQCVVCAHDCCSTKKSNRKLSTPQGKDVGMQSFGMANEGVQAENATSTASTQWQPKSFNGFQRRIIGSKKPAIVSDIRSNNHAIVSKSPGSSFEGGSSQKRDGDREKCEDGCTCINQDMSSTMTQTRHCCDIIEPPRCGILEADWDGNHFSKQLATSFRGSKNTNGSHDRDKSFEGGQNCCCCMDTQPAMMDAHDMGYNYIQDSNTMPPMQTRRGPLPGLTRHKGNNVRPDQMRMELNNVMNAHTGKKHPHGFNEALHNGCTVVCCEKVRNKKKKRRSKSLKQAPMDALTLDDNGDVIFGFSDDSPQQSKVFHVEGMMTMNPPARDIADVVTGQAPQMPISPIIPEFSTPSPPTSILPIRNPQSKLILHTESTQYDINSNDNNHSSQEHPIGSSLPVDNSKMSEVIRKRPKDYPELPIQNQGVQHEEPHHLPTGGTPDDHSHSHDETHDKHRGHHDHRNDDRRPHNHLNDDRRHHDHLNDDRRHHDHLKDDRRHHDHLYDDRRHHHQLSDNGRHHDHLNDDRRHHHHSHNREYSSSPSHNSRVEDHHHNRSQKRHHQSSSHEILDADDHHHRSHKSHHHHQSHRRADGLEDNDDHRHHRHDRRKVSEPSLDSEVYDEDHRHHRHHKTKASESSLNSEAYDGDSHSGKHQRNRSKSWDDNESDHKSQDRKSEKETRTQREHSNHKEDECECTCPKVLLLFANDDVC